MASRVRRRMMTVPILSLLALVSTATLPLAVPAALLVDLVRRKKFSTLRSILFFNYYLVGEVGFVYGLLLHWVVMAGWTRAGKQRLVGYAQRRSDGWGAWLQRGGEIFFGLKIEIDGLDAIDPHSKIVLMLRHVSMGDTVIPPLFFGRRHGMKPRYIAKRELQMDPIFDIIGGRIGVTFVDRSSGRTDEELVPIRDMAKTMVAGDVLLIYPEGTRFTKKKLQRAKVSAQKNLPPALAQKAQSLRNVLPPRLGGALAILEGAPADADVVFAYHVGYEGTTSLRDLLNGRAVNRRLVIKLDRIAAADLPKDPNDRAAWLFDRWCAIDQWVSDKRRELFPNELSATELEPASETDALLAAAEELLTPTPEVAPTNTSS